MQEVTTQILSAVKSTPKVVDAVNVVYGLAIGFLAFAFGEHWRLFVGLLVLNATDWISGTYKARKLQISSSEEGAKGIVKKVWQWVVIAVAFYVSHAFVEIGQVTGIPLDFVGAFGWLTLAMYLVNELRSILENLIEIGVDVPVFLVKGLDIANKLMDDKAEHALPADEEVQNED